MAGNTGHLPSGDLNLSLCISQEHPTPAQWLYSLTFFGYTHFQQLKHVVNHTRTWQTSVRKAEQRKAAVTHLGRIFSPL